MSKGEKSDRERKKDNKKEGKNNKSIYSSKHIRQIQANTGKYKKK